ncbi:MAG: SoxR reducing system RseC family protein [Candidatus Omnitrophica bacterium]|nr:SoxR reducing system RseC family protein [Candidatus Omnitrophota bacterium]
MQVIKHAGTIAQILSNTVIVNVQNPSSCSSCSCGCETKSECSTIQIEIECNTKQFKIGDTLQVIMKPVIGISAFLCAAIVPLAVIVSTFILNSHFNRPKLLWGSSVISIVIYCICLGFIYQKASKEFICSIEKS